MSRLFLFPAFPGRRRTSPRRVLAALGCWVALLLGGFMAAFVSVPAAAAGATPAIAAPAASAAAGAASASNGTVAVLTSTGLVRMPDGRLLAPEFARIEARGELVVALLGFDQPPFFAQKDGQLVGIDIDIAKDIAAKLGVKVRFDRDATTFDGVVDLLANGGADLAVSKLSRTLSRAEVVSFSTPYVNLHRALLLNRVKFAQLAHGRPVPEVIRAYDGTMGVVTNSSYASYVKNNFPGAKVQSYPTWEALLKALDAGDVTAAYRDEFEVKHVLKADPTASLRLRVVTLDDLVDPIAIGVNVNAPALLAFVNQYLAERSQKIDVMTLLQASTD